MCSGQAGKWRHQDNCSLQLSQADLTQQGVMQGAFGRIGEHPKGKGPPGIRTQHPTMPPCPEALPKYSWSSAGVELPAPSCAMGSLPGLPLSLCSWGCVSPRSPCTLKSLFPPAACWKMCQEVFYLETLREHLGKAENRRKSLLLPRDFPFPSHCRVTPPALADERGTLGLHSLSATAAPGCGIWTETCSLL